MPGAAVVATQLTTPETLTESVYLGGVRLDDVMKWDSINVEEGGPSDPGSFGAHLIASQTDLPMLTDLAELRLVDHTADNDRIWTGYVNSRRPFSTPGYEGKTDMQAIDIAALLDWSFIAFEGRPSESIQARIGYLWGKYAGHHLSPDLSYVEAIGTCDAQKFTSLTLRDAIEASLAQISENATYRLDMRGRIHIYESEVNDAPFDVNDDSPGVGEISVENLSVEWEAASYANTLYVQGANKAGSGYFSNGAAIQRANGLVVMKRVEAPDCDTAAKARRFAARYLRAVSTAAARGVFDTQTDGWRQGQNVTITSLANDLDHDVFPIARVSWRYRRSGPDRVKVYTIEFGRPEAGTQRS